MSEHKIDDVFSRFAWTREYFHELDRAVINKNVVQKFIKDKIRQVGILRFNQFLSEIGSVPIDNHIKWIEDNINNIQHIEFMSQNPAAIELLYKYPEKINWDHLSCNPAAMELLIANPDKINWLFISENPAAIELLRANLDKVEWMELSSNPAAIEILAANLDKVDWYEVSANPAAMSLIEANLDQVDWDMLYMNPAAIKLIKAKMKEGKINWKRLSSNPNGWKLLRKDADWRAVSATANNLQFLIDNFDKLKFQELSGNPVAIPILANHLDKVSWYRLSKNPAAIELLKNSKVMIDWNGLIVNKYNYEEEKIAAFNMADLFPITHQTI